MCSTECMSVCLCILVCVCVWVLAWPTIFNYMLNIVGHGVGDIELNIPHRLDKPDDDSVSLNKAVKDGLL